MEREEDANVSIILTEWHFKLTLTKSVIHTSEDSIDMFSILCRLKAVVNETVHKETTVQNVFESISVHTLETQRFCVSKFDNKKHI